jgi:hypothetical protein
VISVTSPPRRVCMDCLERYHGGAYKACGHGFILGPADDKGVQRAMANPDEECSRCHKKAECYCPDEQARE